MHHTDYSGSFLLVPVQMLCLHTNSYSLEIIYVQGKLNLFLKKKIVAKDELYITCTPLLRSVEPKFDSYACSQSKLLLLLFE